MSSWPAGSAPLLRLAWSWPKQRRRQVQLHPIDDSLAQVEGANRWLSHGARGGSHRSWFVWIYCEGQGKDPKLENDPLLARRIWNTNEREDKETQHDPNHERHMGLPIQSPLLDYLYLAEWLVDQTLEAEVAAAAESEIWGRDQSSIATDALRKNGLQTCSKWSIPVHAESTSMWRRLSVQQLSRQRMLVHFIRKFQRVRQQWP